MLFHDLHITLRWKSHYTPGWQNSIDAPHEPGRTSVSTGNEKKALRRAQILPGGSGSGGELAWPESA
jgi:hypothetical protein